MEKQKSWFKTQVDFENSFIFWFALMWQNTYIQLFIVGFSTLLCQVIKIGWVLDTVSKNFESGGAFGGIATIIGMFIPITASSIIVYKGFFQFWKTLKNENKK